jgi:hypothetical protein
MRKIFIILFIFIVSQEIMSQSKYRYFPRGHAMVEDRFNNNNGLGLNNGNEPGGAAPNIPNFGNTRLKDLTGLLTEINLQGGPVFKGIGMPEFADCDTYVSSILFGFSKKEACPMNTDCLFQGGACVLPIPPENQIKYGQQIDHHEGGSNIYSLHCVILKRPDGITAVEEGTSTVSDKFTEGDVISLSIPGRDRYTNDVYFKYFYSTNEDATNSVDISDPQKFVIPSDKGKTIYLFAQPIKTNGFTLMIGPRVAVPIQIFEKANVTLLPSSDISDNNGAGKLVIADSEFIKCSGVKFNSLDFIINNADNRIDKYVIHINRNVLSQPISSKEFKGWSGNVFTGNITLAGEGRNGGSYVYRVEGYVGNKIVTTKSKIFTLNNYTPLHIVTTLNKNCPGIKAGEAKVILSANNPSISSWKTITNSNYTNGSEVIGLTLGTPSTVWVKDNNGCESQISVTPEAQPIPNFELRSGGSTISSNSTGVSEIKTCEGNSVVYRLNGNWEFTHGNKEISRVYSTSGKESITSAYNTVIGGTCAISKEINVNVPVPATLSVSDKLCNDSKLEINVSEANIINAGNFVSGSGIIDFNSGIYATKPGTFKARYNHDGCNFETNSITIDEHPQISGNLHTDKLIFCSSDSEKDIQFVGGKPDYNYSWNVTGSGNSTVSTVPYSFAEATINLTVTDNNNCTKSFSSVIDRRTDLTDANLTYSSKEICRNLGSADVELQLKDLPYTGLKLYFGADDTNPVTISGNAGTVSNSFAVNANSTVLVKDDYCTLYQKSDVFVTHYDEFKLSVPTIVNPECSTSGNVGSVAVDVIGGSGNFVSELVDKFNNSLSPANVNMAAGRNTIFNNLADGRYKIKVTDNTCGNNLYSDAAQIAHPIKATYAIDKFDVKCFGNSTGAVTITPDNGDSRAFQYQLKAVDDLGNESTVASDNQAKNIIQLDRLVAGNYKVITEMKVCNETPVTANITIQQPVKRLAAVASEISKSTCKAVEDGAVKLNLTGGTLPYSVDMEIFREGNSVKKYAQIDFTTEGDNALQNKFAGDYSLKVTDNNGCILTDNFTLGSKPEIDFSLTGTNLKCNNDNTGSLTIQNVVNGAASDVGYNYTIDNGSQKQIKSGETKDHSDLSAKVYSVMVSDSKGCSATRSVTITEPESLAVTSVVTHISKNGQTDASISPSVTGGTTPYNYNWTKESFNSSDEIAINLSKGEYTLNITDKNECKLTDSYTVIEPEPVTAKASDIIKVRCNGERNGTIDFTPIGGWYLSATGDVQGFGYSLSTKSGTTVFAKIDPDAAENTFTPQYDGNTINVKSSANGSNIRVEQLPAGNYILTVYDNMSSHDFNIEVQQPEQMTLSGTVTNTVKCYGDKNGTVTLNAAGGNGGYLYSINDNTIAGGVHNNLEAGNYKYKVTDSKNCVAELKQSVNQPKRLSSSVTKRFYGSYNISKHGSTDLLSVNVKGGVAPYTVTGIGDDVNMQDATTPCQFNNLSANSYNLNVEDANNCQLKSAINVELKQPEPIDIKLSFTDAKCVGGNTGTIDARVTGGVPIGYKWTVKDSEGNTVLVKDGDALNADRIKKEDLVAGLYVVSVENSFGDKISKQVTISDPEPIDIAMASKIINCKDSDKTLMIPRVTGGSGQYNYEWLDSDGNTLANREVFSVSAGGEYSLKVTDRESCINRLTDQEEFTTKSFTVADPSAELDFTTSVTDPTPGNNRYVVTVDASGGYGDYTYSNDNIRFTDLNTFNFSEGGDYKLYLKDQAGCVIEKELRLNSFEPYHLKILTSDNPSCFGIRDGLIKIEAKGGKEPYRYNLTSQSGTISTSSTGVFNNLSSGLYSLYAIDADGVRTESQLTELSSPEQLQIVDKQITYPSCGESNGIIEVGLTDHTENIVYNWQTPDGAVSGSVQNNLKGGLYKVTASVSGCTVSKEYNLSETGAPVIEVNTVSPDICNSGNGAVDITVTTPVDSYTTLWSNGTTTEDIDNVNNGDYTVTVTDKYGCKSVKHINLNITNLADVTYKVTHPVNTTGKGSVKLDTDYTHLTMNVRGKTNSVDKTSVGVVNELPAGDYIVDIYDNNCLTNKVTREFAVIVPESDLAQSSTVSKPICYGTNTAEITVKANGGIAPYRYTIDDINWQTDNRFINISSGNYNIKVEDFLGNKISESITVAEPQQLEFNVESIVPVSCYKGSDGVINLGGVQGVAPVWFSDDKINRAAKASDLLTDLTKGDYNVIARDRNNCIKELSVSVTEPDTMKLIFDAIEHPTCTQNNGSVIATATGGSGNYRFEWKDGGVTTAENSNLAPGKYKVKVVDKNNCVTEDEIEMVDRPAPVISKIDVKDALCWNSSDGSVTIETTGGTGTIDVNWNDSENQNGYTAKSLIKGEYKVTVTDENNCITTKDITVNAPSEVTAAISAQNDPLCFGNNDGTITVNANGGTGNLAYSINGASATNKLFGSLAAGDYTVTVTDDNGCERQVTTTLNNPPKIDIELKDTMYLCNNEVIKLDAGHPDKQHNWASTDAGIFTSAQKIDINKAGKYKLTVTDNIGCVAKDSVQVISRNTDIDANFILASKAYVSDTIVFIEISWPVPDSVKWHLPAELPVIKKVGDYEVHVKATAKGSYYAGVTTYNEGCYKFYSRSVDIEPLANKPPQVPTESRNEVISSSMVYPNPNNGQFSVDITLTERVPIQVSLVDISGKRYFTVNNSGQLHYVISNSNVTLKSGIYLLQIKAGNQVIVKKVIVQK